MMSVNVSATQLTDPTFPEAVYLALLEHDLPAGQLLLELTESALIDFDRANVALAELKQLGVQLGIDDFGIGYSSLARLQQLPFDVLKLDKSFIDGVGTRGRSLDIVGSVIDLAHVLGLRTVAEGVETRSQMLHLQEVGCEFGQGFLWSGAVHESVAKEQVGLNS
jgi:EAL domain-containing protein (putative c-di-GMP-specific phosphodiesterase class I)